MQDVSKAHPVQALQHHDVCNCTTRLKSKMGE